MEGQRKTEQHLFLKSDLAKEVWLYFGCRLHKQFSSHSILHLITGWMHGVSRRSQLGYTTLAIIFYGLWEIWKDRCAIKYEGTRKSTHRILQVIYEHLYNVNLLHIPERKPSIWEANI